MRRLSTKESGVQGKVGNNKPQMTLKEAISFLAQSLQIRCLAIMALSQGLATSLIELAWKSHLHMLHPSPAAYAVC
jgi:ATP:ADP antiporter, AAA family